MMMKTSHHLRLQLVLLGLATVSASELIVIPGFHLAEARRDEARYEGADGVAVHGGDHLHDPCTSYLPADGGGARYTWGSRYDRARGYVAVDDCRVVTCTKYTSPVTGAHGGETVVYDIVPDGDDEDASTTAADDDDVPALEVREPAGCFCNYEFKWQIDERQDAMCFVSQAVLLVDRDEPDCAVDDVLSGPSVSVPCGDYGGQTEQQESPNRNDTDDARSGPKDPVLTEGPDASYDSDEGVGALLASLLSLALLCCCCVFCLIFFRRRRRDKEDDDYANDDEHSTHSGVAAVFYNNNDNDDEQDFEEEGPVLTRDHSEITEGGSKISWFTFGRSSQKKEAPNGVEEQAANPSKSSGFFSFFGKQPQTKKIQDDETTPRETPESSPYRDEPLAGADDFSEDNNKENEQNKSIVDETDEGFDLICCGLPRC